MIAATVFVLSCLLGSHTPPAQGPAPAPDAAAAAERWVLHAVMKQDTYGVDPDKPATSRGSDERWYVDIEPEPGTDDLRATVKRVVVKFDMAPMPEMLVDTDTDPDTVKDATLNALLTVMRVGINKKYVLERDEKGELTAVRMPVKYSGPTQAPLARLFDPMRALDSYKVMWRAKPVQLGETKATWEEELRWMDERIPTVAKPGQNTAMMKLNYEGHAQGDSAVLRWSGERRQSEPSPHDRAQKLDLFVRRDGHGRWHTEAWRPIEARSVETMEMKFMFEPDQPVRNVTSTELRWQRASAQAQVDKLGQPAGAAEKPADTPAPAPAR
jgi:hypothetical protein